jgi:predicted deacylase
VSTTTNLPEIDGRVFEAGTKSHLYFDAGETVTGPMRLPVTVISGETEGPRLAITAACHPGEYNGITASVLLAKRLDPSMLKGSVVIVHVLNVPGVQSKVGHTNPVDGVNLSRAYPVPGRTIEITGNVSHQTRSPTYQIGERIFYDIVSNSDYYIDLHGGEFFEFVFPNIEYFLTGNEDTDEQIRALASAFGFRLLWEVPDGSIPEMPSYPGRGSCVLEACMQGIPAVLCEVGGEGRVETDLVETTVNGLLGALKHLQMIEDAPPASSERLVTLIGGHVLFAQRAGIFLSSVSAGEEVREGQSLGRIMDLTGEYVEEFHAPEDSVLLNLVTRGIANPGDMLFVLGNLKES